MRWAKRFACAIRSTGSSYPGRHAWCAAERRPTPITFDLSSLVRWAAGSVTSSRYHCVASTTVSFTAKVTRLHGGVSSPSILYRSRSGYGSTHGVNGTAFPTSGGAELGSATATEKSQQGPASTSLDPGIDAGSSASKPTDGITSQ